jgi:hypothetical protein
MGGLAKVDAKRIMKNFHNFNVFGKSLDIRGECINDGLELASSFCRSYEAKYFKMNKAGSSENSPRFISGFSIFTL